jgi:hypothetical protein
MRADRLSALPIQAAPQPAGRVAGSQTVTLNGPGPGGELGETMRSNDAGEEPAGGQEAMHDVSDAGTLVIRTWHEHGGQSPAFRARITYGPAHSRDQTTVSAADADRVLHIVQQWLLSQAAAPGGN